MGLLKVMLTGLMMFMGALSLYAGLGIQFDVPGDTLLASYGIPIGLGLLLFSVLVAKSGWVDSHEIQHPNK